jgi:predicted site-specific integrase-resolvase
MVISGGDDDVCRASVVTAEQLAKRWQINVKTIQRHVRKGTFPIRPVFPDARAQRFSIAAVEAHESGTL